VRDNAAAGVVVSSEAARLPSNAAERRGSGAAAVDAAVAVAEFRP
jgi:hypothetical protein